MSKVLVTGASGFLGPHVVLALRANGHEVIEARRASGDIADAAAWRQFPRADAVVHLAGKSFVPESWQMPDTFVRTNLGGAIQAMEYCRAHAAHLVYPSSYMYGDAVEQPIAESSPLVARNPYALSKKLAEEACAFYAERFGLTITILRPFNIYGPGQSQAFLVPTILNQLTAGKAIRVQDLEPRRDYVYVVDVAEAMVKALSAPQGLRVFNIGSGASHSVGELINLMQNVWGSRLPVSSDGVRRKDEIMDTVADITRAEHQLGWKPRFTLRQGMEALRAAL
jgi:GDP-4-dehydro-6-deoxy-D-mannose reductase